MSTWFKAATVRAIKTAAQAGLGVIGTAVVLSEVNWVYMVSAILVATLASYLTSIAGIPEVDGGESLAQIETSNKSALGNSPEDAPTIAEGK